MNKKKENEQRKSERYPMELEVLLSDGKFFVNSIIYDVCLGGIGIESSKKMEVGSSVNLVLDTDPPLKMQGIVRWCTKKGLKSHVGIQFTDIKPGQEWQLSQLLSSKAWDNTHSK